MTRLTERDSLYNNLETKSTGELLREINQEDQKVALVVKESIPEIEQLVEAIVNKMGQGGRLIYIGAGTSGRLGVVDASECPPTFGVADGRVLGLIAGGDSAMRKAVEFAEDSTDLAWTDLCAHKISAKDVVIGIAASGTTPYVVHGLKKCQSEGIMTGCICCNPNSIITEHADFPIVLAVGPEYVTGSTRMKAGTAQKLCLNMISTATMIKLGHVKGNKMVDMQIANNKLVARGIKMIVESSSISEIEARELLLKHGSVRKALAAIS